MENFDLNWATLTLSDFRGHILAYAKCDRVVCGFPVARWIQDHFNTDDLEIIVCPVLDWDVYGYNKRFGVMPVMRVHNFYGLSSKEIR